jgi:class 3 adenylate cyclase
MVDDVGLVRGLYKSLRVSLNEDEQGIIQALVTQSLDEAEQVWDKHQPVFEAATALIATDSILKRAEVAPSRIPGHPFVSSENSEIAEYVCLVADMRESSEHLMMHYSRSNPTYTMMKRLYFETAALLPALDQTIQFENGSVTEYLGDGVLGLFSVDPEDRGLGIKRAHRAAQNCVNDTRAIVNDEIAKRYKLPDLDLGVGLGFGDAIVQLIGVPNMKHPKVIGPCVYYATKLSYGKNEVIINESLRKAWPSSEGGKLTFKHTSGKRGVEGYRVG